jgi:hypothetical protein
MRCDLIGCGIADPYEMARAATFDRGPALADMLRRGVRQYRYLALCLPEAGSDSRHIPIVVFILELLQLSVLFNFDIDLYLLDYYSNNIVLSLV